MNKKHTYIVLTSITMICVFFVLFIGQSNTNSLDILQSQKNELMKNNIEHTAGPHVLRVTTADGSIQSYKILFANTPELRAKGLGGRKILESDEVMLFIFDEVSKHYFWMKDMKFSIDIIWLNSDKEVIYIAQDVSPDTFPKSFGPEVGSKYVLEFIAGVASSTGIKIGNKIDF